MENIQDRISIVLPTYNEKENIEPLLDSLFSVSCVYKFEVLIVDDDSTDGTPELVRDLARKDSRIRLLSRIGRFGLASAIKEGLMNVPGDIAVVMDSDGQHRPSDVIAAIDLLRKDQFDVISGSRFLGPATIKGLSKRRTDGSSFANKLARKSLSRAYSHMTDYMSGCIVMDMSKCLKYIRRVDLNGFKFYYEFLAVSKGELNVGEVPLSFQPRLYGQSKLDVSILWDFLVSLIHTLSFRLLPRRAISFALVGASGVIIQLLMTELLISFKFEFVEALPLSVLTAATSNYLINNFLTFRSQRLRGLNLLKGLLKFLLVASLPVIANIGLATSFYNVISPNTFLAQLAGIFVVFIWNYVASSRFVWNTP